MPRLAPGDGRTLFHDSCLPLRKWVLGDLPDPESKKGISAKHLPRMLKVSYKPAWYLQHRVGNAMGDDEQLLLNGDIVESGRNRHRRQVPPRRPRLHRRQAVVGAAQCGGEVPLKVTVEGVCSPFKRSIVGSYQKMSIKHLPVYLDEMGVRFNSRTTRSRPRYLCS